MAEDVHDPIAPDSIEGMTENGTHPEDDNGQLAILEFGEEKLDLKLGGEKPTKSTLKIKATETTITGEIGNGRDDNAIYAFVVIGQIDNVSFPIKRTDTGQVEEKTRQHVLGVKSVIPITPELAMELAEREGVRV